MKFRKERKEMMQVNMTPLIDVVFLLLIFFMVSTSFTKENQLQISLPEAEAEQVPADDRGLALGIQKNGLYTLNGQALANGKVETLLRALRVESGMDLSQSLTLIADAEATHQSVVTAMDAAGRLGFVNLRISTQEPSVNSESSADKTDNSLE